MTDRLYRLVIADLFYRETHPSSSPTFKHVLKYILIVVWDDADFSGILSFF